MVSLKYFQIYRNVKIRYESRDHYRIAKSLIFTRFCILYMFKLHHILFSSSLLTFLSCYIIYANLELTQQQNVLNALYAKTFVKIMYSRSAQIWWLLCKYWKNANDWICSQCNKLIFPYNHIDDDGGFIQCLSENWHVIIGTNINELQEKVFNPFEVNSEKSNLPMFDCDPDFHNYNLLCNSLSSCDYYLEDSFNGKCEELSLTSGCFSLLHCNIRSILKICMTLNCTWVAWA